MSHKIELTGRTQYRVQYRWLRKPLVVLQLEEHHTWYLSDENGLGHDFDYCSWRDAEVGDVTLKGS